MNDTLEMNGVKTAPFRSKFKQYHREPSNLLLDNKIFLQKCIYKLESANLFEARRRGLVVRVKIHVLKGHELESRPRCRDHLSCTIN
jgi:hypothetical protein